MKLKSPFMITPRLMPGVRIGDTVISISATCIGSDRRCRYLVYFDRNGREYHKDTTFRGPATGERSIREGMMAVLSFLSAAAESVRYEMSGHKSDNSDLFPKHVMQWAYMHQGEIAMTRLEIEEDPSCVQE